ncbi:MAG: alpha/beta hydrolase [Oscillospiraceae bacterium]
MTREDRLAWGDRIRAEQGLKFEIPQKYREYERRVIRNAFTIKTSVGPSRCYMTLPPVTREKYPLYINFHGGGFVCGYNESNPAFCAMISCMLGCKVIDVDYRLAPQFPYPAAIDEGYDVVKWAFEHADELSILADRIIVGGHSAGGTITAAIALKANQTGDFRMALQFMDYPGLDQITAPEEKLAAAVRGNGGKPLERPLKLDRCHAFNTLYVEDESRVKEPLASPVFAPPEMVRGMPPVLIISAGQDFLWPEHDTYARLLIDNGVTVTMKRYLHSSHAFMMYFHGEYEQGHKFLTDQMRAVFENGPAEP